MTAYSASERKIARILSSAPRIKATIKYCYEWLNYVFYGLGKPRYSSLCEVKAVKDLLPNEWQDAELFFGYYDKPAENEQGLILVNATLDRQTTKVPSANIQIHVLVVDKNDPNCNPLMDLETSAYNWQQGCRAQWLDNDLFIMNFYDEKQDLYISKVFSVSCRREIKRFDHPVQDSFSTDFFIAINYQRVMTLRPDYGYRNKPNLNTNDLQELDTDGIWLVDYETGKVRLFISLRQITEFRSGGYPSEAWHKVNHLEISPDGRKFIFMHRYFIDKQRFDRLIVANSVTGEMQLLADNQMISHYCWVDNLTIFSYLRSPEGVDSYFYIDIETGEYRQMENEIFKMYGDGHPQIKNGVLISDSYPDKARLQHLLCQNNETGQTFELGYFYHPMKYDAETRCDMHPRFSMDGAKIYFDSVFTGKRGLYYIDLTKIRNDK